MSRASAGTYRIQLCPGFGFDRAREILPYLDGLGVGRLYLSPVFQARPGSGHGYDVTDPTRVRAELGDEEALQRLAAAARERGLSLMIDIVPNHLSTHESNPWWWDVMKRGPSSRCARFFDIDWEAGGGRLILPALGDEPARAIDRDELRLDRGSPHDPAEPVIRYHDRAFPLRTDAPTSAVAPALDRQWYRLESWRTGLAGINYRRFFDVADLVGVRQEEDSVFAATHELLLRLVEDGTVAAVRVDHVDGLRDPGDYLARLHEATSSSAERGGRAVPAIIVEKILARDEDLPAAWPVAGTTGYELLNAVNRLLVDPVGLDEIRADAARRTGLDSDPVALRSAAKREVLETLFPAELDRLVDLAAKIDGAGACSRAALHRAVVEVTAALDVYRIYGGERSGPDDQARLESAVRQAQEATTGDDGALAALGWLKAVLAGPSGVPAPPSQVEFRRRWQQLSGAVMAKGLEDTALYRDVALSSLNEVGGEPGPIGDAVAAFHRLCGQRRQLWPGAMNTTATHDTKRGEDTRCRIAVLSEIAGAWTAALDRWFDWHEGLRASTAAGPAPSPADEILMYQSLLGIWPADRDPDHSLADRLADYAVKAAREAKLRTGWLKPDEAYESALQSFARRLVTGPGGQRFREDIGALHEITARCGAVNSLAQLVLKMTAPGVPDVYQGTELWDLVLVDPDNRRPVDFAQPADMLDALREQAHGPALVEHHRNRWRTGSIKLLITARLLQLRRAAPALFVEGDYVPLEPQGPRAQNVCAFARQHGSDLAVVIVARLTAALTRDGSWPTGPHIWSGTTIPCPGHLPANEWLTGRDAMPFGSDDRLDLGQVLDILPVAVIVPDHLSSTI